MVIDADVFLSQYEQIRTANVRTLQRIIHYSPLTTHHPLPLPLKFNT